ncbi:MAG: MFS transporter [Desulfovibrio sp.]|nr:MAG: MFS transporter [Desulfovibrio sp.]
MYQSTNKESFMSIFSTRTGAESAFSKKMLLLASMYLCQAIPLGYVFGSLPVIMREGRMSLAGIGGLFVLHLPWAFKFLYASWVDRTYLPRLGRRRTWIFPLQWLGACLLLAVSQFPPQSHFSAMYVLLLLLNIVMATNDIAVDGYATDILEPWERRWGNTIQAGARYVGMILGGGLMLFMHKSLGWQFLCLALAASVFLLSVPVFLHREMSSLYAGEPGSTGRKGVVAFLRQRNILVLLMLLIAPTVFIFSGFQLRTPMLVDLGLDSKTIGGCSCITPIPLVWLEPLRADGCCTGWAGPCS